MLILEILKGLVSFNYDFEISDPILFPGISGVVMLTCLPTECRERHASCGLAEYFSADARATTASS